MSRSLVAVAAAALAAMAVAPGAGAASHRQRGDIRVFAHIGAPGEPSLTLVTPSKQVYVGTFEDVAGSDTSPSKVFRYDRHGRLKRTYVVRGQTPGAAHGVQVAARDRHGRLYLLDQNPARIVVLDPHSGAQHTYARFADVPPCSAGHTSGCSNTMLDQAPEPDYAAWLPDGSLVVTDYAQQLVWRVPPGGGRAKVWLNDKVFDGELFGPAGIVLMPSHHSLLMTVATGGVTSAGDPSRGRLYRVVLGRHDHVRRLVALWSSDTGAAPDGFALSRDARHAYIAMAGPTASSVVEVARRAHHWRTVWQVPSSPAGTGDSPVPWDTVTSTQFLGRRLLVTNQAYFTDDSAHWVVFDVAVGQRGRPIFVPRHAGHK